MVKILFFFVAMAACKKQLPKGVWFLLFIHTKLNSILCSDDVCVSNWYTRETCQFGKQQKVDSFISVGQEAQYEGTTRH